MATTMELDRVHLSDNEEDLSDEQIQNLLQDAEKRLRARAAETNTALIKAKATDFRLPSLTPGEISQPYIHVDGKIARVEQSQLINERDRVLSSLARKVEDPIVVKKRQLEEKKATAGPSWYNLPRTDLTPELKRDLQLLKMRNVLDPKRHYKKENGKSKAPEFSQVGTVIEGNTEFFSARINNKDRKKTFVEEVLAGEAETGRFKKKYSEVQAAKTSGKKAFYKALKAKRKGRVEKP